MFHIVRKGPCNTIRENPDEHTAHYELVFGDGGKEEHHFNKKGPPAEPGSGKGIHLP